MLNAGGRAFDPEVAGPTWDQFYAGNRQWDLIGADECRDDKERREGGREGV